MKLRYGLLLLVLVAALVVAGVSAQDDGVVIGIVSPNASYESLIASFKTAMTVQGYVEGENISYLYEGPAGDNLATFAQNVVDAAPDAILSVASAGTRAVLALTSDIPVIFAPVLDPAGAGFVASLDAPGGNATGVTNGGSSVPRLNYFLMLVPDARRILVISNPGDPASDSSLAEVTPALEERGLEIVSLQLPDAASVDATIAAMPTDVDAVYMTSGSLLVNVAQQFGEAAVAAGLPLSSVRMPDSGVLLSYFDNLTTTGEIAADMVVQILNGASPADIPVARAKFILSINMDIAATLGMNVTLGQG